jgi:hypothetical protein
MKNLLRAHLIIINNLGGKLTQPKQILSRRYFFCGVMSWKESSEVNNKAFKMDRCLSLRPLMLKIKFHAELLVLNPPSHVAFSCY